MSNNQDLPGVGTRVTFLAKGDGPQGQKEMVVAGYAMTVDPKYPRGPQRPLLVLALNPGFYSEDRSTYVTAFLVCPENVIPVRNGSPS